MTVLEALKRQVALAGSELPELIRMVQQAPTRDDKCNISRIYQKARELYGSGSTANTVKWLAVIRNYYPQAQII